MHHVLIAFLLALTLFTSSLSSSTFNFLEGRVSLCAEAIESVQHSENPHLQSQLQSLRVHIIDATLIEPAPSTTSSADFPVTMDRASFQQPAKKAAAPRKPHRSRLVSEMARDDVKRVNAKRNAINT